MIRYENNAWLRWAPLLLCLCLTGAAAQATDVLERTITVHFRQTPLDDALAEIARQGKFEWSYNARILDQNRTVTLVAEAWTVRETLLYVLQDDYTYRQNGEYLILRRRRKPAEPQLSGYISDRRTGQRMANVTVYDRHTLRSTTTDKNGFYQLPVTPQSQIVVSRLAYRDTVLQVSSATSRLVKLALLPDSLAPARHTTDWREEWDRVAYRMEEFWVRSSQKMASLNVHDSLSRRFQASLGPGIGTNHRLSGSVVNDWSVNLLVGYAQGNRRAELAGLGNITRADMTGLQAAGVFNVLGGRATGVQLAGVCNVLGGDLTGLQAGGVFNQVNGTTRGVQLAGVYNFTRGPVYGAQFGGVFNYTSYSGPSALQAAGVANLAPKGQHAIQLAGAANHAHQASFQAAGLFNSADTLHGTQIAGFLNRAAFVKGTQIGVVNIADSIQGAQIGIINLARHGGYTVLEGSANDVMPVNIAFKSGSPRFYVILTAGYDPASPATDWFWAYGAGLGSLHRLNRWSGLGLDLVSRHINEGAFDNAVQEWVQAGLTLDLKLGRHLSIAGGPSANLFVADPNRFHSAAIRARIAANDWLSEPQNANGWLSAWWGWTAGVRVRF